MFNINNSGIIILSRGDTFSIPLFLNKGNKLYPIRYVVDSKSEIFIGVMEPNATFENAIIKKKYTSENLNENGDVVVSFQSEDTCNLLPGLYYYEVKVKIYESEGIYSINTVIPKKQFFIEE